MLIKLLLKMWPSLTPIIFYLFWTFIVEGIILKKIFKKKDIIEGEKVVGEKSTKESVRKISKFSLENRQFLIALYLSFALAILSFLYMAFSQPKQDARNYVPAQYQNGKIIPSQIK